MSETTQPTGVELQEIAARLVGTRTAGKMMAALHNAACQIAVADAFQPDYCASMGLKPSWAQMVIDKLHGGEIRSIGLLMNWRVKELEELGLSEDDGIIIQGLVRDNYGLEMTT